MFESIKGFYQVKQVEFFISEDFGTWLVVIADYEGKHEIIDTHEYSLINALDYVKRYFEELQSGGLF